MVPVETLHPVPLGVAGGPDHVVHATGRVLDQRQDGLPPRAVQLVAAREGQLEEHASRVDHGQEVVRVLRVEGPEVQDLLAVGVDDLDFLSLLDGERDGLPSWDGGHVA